MHSYLSIRHDSSSIFNSQDSAKPFPMVETGTAPKYDAQDRFAHDARLSCFNKFSGKDDVFDDFSVDFC